MATLIFFYVPDNVTELGGNTSVYSGSVSLCNVNGLL